MPTEIEQELVRFPDGSERAFRDFIADQPPHAVVELAPGRYAGPLSITKPITIRGAGDLTRIAASGRGPVINVAIPREGRAVFDSLLLEDGASPRGGGIAIGEGRVRLNNVHIQRCRAEDGGGGAIAVAGGELEASLLRAHDVVADKGGALWVGGHAMVRLRDSQLRRCEARGGGAIAVEGAARVFLEAVTIGKARASTVGGGQAIWVCGAAAAGEIVPVIELKRVRLEDVPMGAPVVIEGARGELRVEECDLPRNVASVRGVVDVGSNRWR